MFAMRRGLRSLLKHPGTMTAAVMILALGIGASTAISSVVYHLLLRPIPVPGLDELVVGWEMDPSRAASLVEVSLPYFTELRGENRSFESMAAFGSVNWSHVFTEPGRRESVPAAYVSGYFFEALGARPLLGRALFPDDERPGAANVLVLSYALWQRRYSGDPSVVGSTISTGETIVGVMPRDFDFPQGAALWKPVASALQDVRESMGPEAFRGFGVLYVVGRLAPGVPLEAARADLGRISARLSVADGFSSEGWRVELVPLVDHYIGTNTRTALETLAAGGIVLLLLACANAALLLLGHAMARRSDLAVRQALGASAARMVAEEAGKSLVVVSFAATSGALVAWAALKGVAALGPAEIPGLRSLSLDTTALGLGLLISLVVALLVTLAPAWYTSRSSVAPILRTSSGGATPDRRAWHLGSLLVVSEVALAVVLLVGSALLVRSLGQLLRVELGFAPRNAVSFTVARWDEKGRPLQEPAFIRDLVERVRALPEVTAAGTVHLRPLEHGPIGSGAWVLPEDSALDRASLRDNSVKVDWQMATPDYFRAVGTRVIAGRSFSESDTGEVPKVVVVSESIARRLWPGQDPVGKRVHTYGARMRLEGDRFVDVEWMTVVGVVEDARYRGIQRPQPSVYLSYLQAPSLPQHFVVRTSGAPLEVIGAIREQARALDPDARVGGVVTLDELVGRALAPWRFAGSLLSAFAMVALLLTASGLVGVLHSFVTERKREIAIRMAVGATARRVAGRVLAQGLTMTVLGLGLGLVVSLGLAGSLATLLYGVGRYDPWSYLASAVLIASISAAACWLPARSAASTEPIVVLRSE